MDRNQMFKLKSDMAKKKKQLAKRRISQSAKGGALSLQAGLRLKALPPNPISKQPVNPTTGGRGTNATMALHLKALPPNRGTNATMALHLKALPPNLISQQPVNPTTGGRGTNATTVLHLKALPPNFNNEAFLSDHFAMFGHVTDIKCKSSKMCATVTFATHAEAAKAKQLGRNLSPNMPPLKIFWHVDHGSRQTPISKVAPPSRSQCTYVPEANAQSSTFVQSSTFAQSSTFPQSSTFAQSSTVPLEAVASRDPQKLYGSRHEIQGVVPPEQETVALKQEMIRGGDISNPFIANMKSSKPKKIAKRKLPMYDDVEEWLPGEEEEGLGGDQTGYGRVRKSVMRDLGNKVTGDEMDTIARFAPYSYYLRSLDRPDQIRVLPLGPGNGATPFVTCPYTLPKPCLPATPTPKGNSANDFYEALDARDNEIRKGMTKEKSLKARMIVGTCPDMCPEKERYRREDTRRLSYFEVTSDTEPRNPRVDHTLAVKEYSGAAADKEEPLPHELRPISVLQMTMDHLVTKVMDAGEGRPNDWYDFMWNRTRGIRKDMTIQHIRLPEGVELMEKCARFHVLCAHHLCEEETIAFSPKMNDENMKNCLLSLKELYLDMRLGQGMQCPNEPEFCCYDILLHLSDGSVLNIVQDYSPASSKSPEVIFAVDAALAFESNNFIKFFKLVKSATFLSACLLHRYFTVVRVRGLKVLNRAHSMQKRCTPFPLPDLARMLAFADEAEASGFCGLFDLELTEDGVLFDRTKTETIILEGKPLPLCQNKPLVLFKNIKSLGEVVNGRPLPPPYFHSPHCSFSSSAPTTHFPDTQHVEAGVVAMPPQALFSLQDVVAARDELVAEVAEEQTKELIQEVAAEELEQEVIARSMVSATVLVEEVESEVQVVVEEVLAEARRKEEVLWSMCENVTEDMCRDVVLQAVEDMCRECVLDAEVMMVLVREIVVDDVEEVVGGMVELVVRKELGHAKAMRTKRLAALSHKFQQYQLLRYWKRWSSALQLRRHLQQCAEAVPPLPPLLTLTQQVDRLLPPGRRKHLDGSGCKPVDERVLETSRMEAEIRIKAQCSPLDLCPLLRDSILLSRSPCPSSYPSPSLYWKLLVLYPCISDLSSNMQQELSWICLKLRSLHAATRELPGSALTLALRDLDVPVLPLSVTSADLVSLSVPGTAEFADLSTCGSGGERQLHVVVQGVSSLARGLDLDCLRRAVLGTCSLAMFVPAPSCDDGYPEISITAQLAVVMEVLDRHKTRHAVKVPLLLMYSSKLEEKHLAFWYRSRAALEMYCRDKPISHILWMKVDAHELSSSPECVEAQLKAQLCSLASCSPPQPSLSRCSVQDYLEQGLNKHFFPLVIADRQKRAEARLPSQPPGPLVKLFNAVVNHLSCQVSREELLALQWPLPEFAKQSKFSSGALPPLHWNLPSHLQELHDLLASLVMPDNDRDLPEMEGEWSELCAGCLAYVSSLHPQPSIVLLSRVKSLLHQHFMRNRSCMWSPSNSNCLSVPWDHVILVCAEDIISSVNSELWVSDLDGDEEGRDEFCLPMEWLRAQADTAINCTDTFLSTSTLASHKRHIHQRLSNPPPYMLDDLQKMRRRLEESIHTEKQLSENFEGELQQWLSSPVPVVQSRSVLGSIGSGADVETEAHCAEENLISKLDRLSKEVRTAKWQAAMDLVSLHSLAKDNSVASVIAATTPTFSRHDYAHTISQ